MSILFLTDLGRTTLHDLALLSRLKISFATVGFNLASITYAKPVEAENDRIKP